MRKIKNGLNIDENEIRFLNLKSGGPGGQNVNKVSSGVQLRFDVERSRSLPLHLKRRLREIAGNYISSEGILTIKATRYRHQYQNREDALHRFISLIKKAATPEKARIPTKPDRSAIFKRLFEKKKVSEKKKLRRKRLSAYLD